MRIADVLSPISTLYVETTPLIYYVEENVSYVERMEIIIGLIESRPIRVISSAITLTEVLFYPIQLGRTDLENAYRDILSNTGVFQLWPVTTSIAERAARLRVEHNLRTPDALHLATAVLTGCEAFLTNDQRLKRVGDINVLTLDDLSTDEV